MCAAGRRPAAVQGGCRSGWWADGGPLGPVQGVLAAGVAAVVGQGGGVAEPAAPGDDVVPRLPLAGELLRQRTSTPGRAVGGGSAPVDSGPEADIRVSPSRRARRERASRPLLIVRRGRPPASPSAAPSPRFRAGWDGWDEPVRSTAARLPMRSARLARLADGAGKRRRGPRTARPLDDRRPRMPADRVARPVRSAASCSGPGRSSGPPTACRSLSRLLLLLTVLAVVPLAALVGATVSGHLHEVARQQQADRASVPATLLLDAGPSADGRPGARGRRLGRRGRRPAHRPGPGPPGAPGPAPWSACGSTAPGRSTTAPLGDGDIAADDGGRGGARTRAAHWPSWRSATSSSSPPSTGGGHAAGPRAGPPSSRSGAPAGPDRPAGVSPARRSRRRRARPAAAGCPRARRGPRRAAR